MGGETEAPLSQPFQPVGQPPALHEVMAAFNFKKTKEGGNNGEREIQTLHELMKHMKGVYNKNQKTRVDQVPLEAKITSRRMEEFGFCSQPVIDNTVLWQEAYGRKKDTMRSGNFSLNYKPYKTLGHVELDPVQLFLGCMRHAVHEIPRFSYNLSGGFTKHNLPAKKPEAGLSDAKKNELCDLLEREKACKHAGLQLMKHVLADTCHHITATRGGQLYVKHVQHCQLEREAERRLSARARREESSMTLQSLGSDLLHAPVAGYINIAARDANDSDSTQGGLAADTAKTGFVNFKQQRKLQAVTDKLTYIHLLLCSVYNMRTKALRTKQPLSVEAVKALRRDPFSRKQDLMRSRAHTLRSSSIVSVGSTPGFASHAGPAGPTLVSSTGEGRESKIPVLVHPASEVGTSRRFSGFRNTQAKTLLTTGMAQEPNMGRRKTRSRLLNMIGQSQDMNTKVDTWDDLLNLGTKTKLLKLLRAKSLPPWQQQWSSEDSPQATKDTDEEHLQTYHSEEAVARMRAGWLRVKERSSKAIKQDMEKIERERMIKFRYKMSTLQYADPLYERQRLVMKQSARVAVRDPVLITEDIVPWYEDLIKECVSLGVRQEPTVIECLGKIEKFLLEDVTCVPNVKEKLCLLVLSLPIYEVCTPHVQTAVTFVLTEILDGKPSMLKEWLHYRKLYVITPAPPTAHV